MKKRGRPTKEEQLAWLRRKARRGPDVFSVELPTGETLTWQCHADTDAEIQMVYSSGNATVFLNFMLPKARELHRMLGKAIEREEEEQYYCQPARNKK